MIIKLKFKDTPAGQETIFPDVNGATLKADTDLDLTDWTPSNPNWETEAEATFTSTKNKADFSQPDINNRLILEGVINRHHTAPASTGGGSTVTGTGVYPTEDYGMITSVSDTKFGEPLVYLEREGDSLKTDALKSDSKLIEFHGNQVTGNIGKSAFNGCPNLRLVSFPLMTGNIEDVVFENCSKLTTANFLSMTGNIGTSAFYNCSVLTTANFPSMTGNIGTTAFSICPELKTASFPLMTGSMGFWAFNKSPKLKDLKLNVAMKSKYSADWGLSAGCVITYLNDDGSVDSTQTV